jgi:hypothetical protein
LGLEHIYIRLQPPLISRGFNSYRQYPDKLYIAAQATQSSLSLNQLSTTILNNNPQHQSQPTNQYQHHLISPPTQTNPPTPPKMSSSNWEQHFLDKFIASSSRPATPTSSQPQPRNASPARWRPSARYNGLPTPSSSGSDRVPSNTSAAH